ncbi:MAG: hypothetical protein JNJ83_00465 [Verrucomicrobiaceae bacterium]|nr:hypothetical protein [Verrucomicrobiaceae bacterium]
MKSIIRLIVWGVPFGILYGIINSSQGANEWAILAGMPAFVIAYYLDRAYLGDAQTASYPDEVGVCMKCRGSGKVTCSRCQGSGLAFGEPCGWCCGSGSEDCVH